MPFSNVRSNILRKVNRVTATVMSLKWWIGDVLSGIIFGPSRAARCIGLIPFLSLGGPQQVTPMRIPKPWSEASACEVAVEASWPFAYSKYFRQQVGSHGTKVLCFVPPFLVKKWRRCYCYWMNVRSFFRASQTVAQHSGRSGEDITTFINCFTALCSIEDRSFIVDISTHFWHLDT